MTVRGARESRPPMNRAALALVLSSILWGTTGTAARLLPADVSPLAVGSATMGVGGVLLFGISMRLAISALQDPAARRWLLVGAAGVVVYPLAFYGAMNLAGVAIGNVVALGSGPVFAAFFEWAGERRRLGRVWVASTATAIVGIGLLALGGSARGDRPEANVASGVILGLVAGSAFAFYTYASSRAMTLGLPSRGVMGGMFGLGAMGLLPVLLVTCLLFGIALGTLRSSAATTIALIESLIATVLAVVVGERLGAVGWVGLALILAGVIALSTARYPHNRP